MENCGTVLTLALVSVISLSGVYSLQCYTCIPVLQTGQDCSRVDAGQLQQCRNDEDICRVTAVTLPIAGIAQSTVVPTINRGCFRSSDLNSGIGQYSPPLNTRSSSCQSYTENQRVSRTCRCNFDGCNSWTATQLQNNDVSGNTGSGYQQGGYYNSGVTLSAGQAVLGLSTAFLVALNRIFFV